MRARKNFVVIAYDITRQRKRNKVVKTVQKYGGRSNLSVFECMVTDGELWKLKEEIRNIIDPKTDSVVYYPLCMDCFAKIRYEPEKHERERTSAATVL